MTERTRYLRLPFSFDVARLRRELDMLEGSQWIGHFNSGAYEGAWSCIPLRSVDGRLDHIMPLENSAFRDTAVLEGCPYFREVIDRFECEKTSVRLMSLEAGGVIREHRDSGASLDDGVTRLHVPIRTSPHVKFRIDGEEVHFSAGDTWYLNASCLHGVENRGPAARVHLMIDCVTNEWLERAFQEAGGILREPPPYGDGAINDGNVLDVVASLRAGGHAVAARLADELEAIHARRTSTDTLSPG
jgi:quercetin dioxygenase-like cupin family protein